MHNGTLSIVVVGLVRNNEQSKKFSRNITPKVLLAAIKNTVGLPYRFNFRDRQYFQGR